MIEHIYLSPRAGDAQREAAFADLAAGAGIEGDRYFGAHDEPGQNLTLIEAEEIEAFNEAAGTAWGYGRSGRNLVTRGVRLNELVGREFAVGTVRLKGVELCEPCSVMGGRLATPQLTPAAVVKRFVHRAGLRADVLSSGRIEAGMRLWLPCEGGCTCRQVRYRIAVEPLFVHCCHCRWCQRETGSAFALNAMVESNHVELLAGAVEAVATPSASGRGQQIVRCPHCRVALWSHYAGAGEAVRFVRVGTLDEPDRLPPDIHIYTASKQPWVVLPPGMPAVPEYYKASEHWPAGSLARREALRRAA